LSESSEHESLKARLVARQSDGSERPIRSYIDPEGEVFGLDVEGLVLYEDMTWDFVENVTLVTYGPIEKA
jgi:hypothetical protein